MNTALALHVEIYAIGDKYHLPRLCKFARIQYKERLPRIKDHKVFLSLIPLVYESTPGSNRGIRDIVIWNARKNYYMYPMPWQAGCKSLGAMSNIDVCGTNMRDHDFGKDVNNE